MIFNILEMVKSSFINCITSNSVLYVVEYDHNVRLITIEMDGL